MQKQMHCVEHFYNQYLLPMLLIWDSSKQGNGFAPSTDVPAWLHGRNLLSPLSPDNAKVSSGHVLSELWGRPY